MEDALEVYRRIIAEQPICESSSFADALARYRAGDEMGARTISATCLRMALQIAERRAQSFAAFSLLDLAQEANVGLMGAITTFPGDSLEEFLVFAEEKINQRLALLV
ncbi:MAG: hypothetical protein K2R98_07900 [Gemmataceae bacterium]|nr:hypothetical protein [Gemmataceae bacterium]